MKHYAHTSRYIIFGLVLAFAFMTSGALRSASAQNNTGHATDARPRSRERDPFEKYRPPTKKPRVVATQITPPSIKERIERYKAQKLAAMNAQLPAPKPTTALLLSEVQITGIFRTPRGYAAMVEAAPIKLSYVIYPGETFFDGQLVAIEEDRLVFRRQTLWTDGRREMVVEIKPLRQPTLVDTMSTTKGAGAAAATTPSNEPAPSQGTRPALPEK